MDKRKILGAILLTIGLGSIAIFLTLTLGIGLFSIILGISVTLTGLIVGGVYLLAGEK